jgi:hypothetical protein
MQYVWRLGMVVSMQMSMSIPCTRGVRQGCAVANDFNPRQRLSAHERRDRMHRFVTRSDTAHRRVRRPGQVTRICPTGVYANAWVACHIETDDAVQTIRSVRAGVVAMRSHPILDGVRSVGQVRQRRVTVDVVVGCPCPFSFAIVSDKRYLVSLPVEYQLGHQVSSAGQCRGTEGLMYFLWRVCLLISGKYWATDPLRGGSVAAARGPGSGPGGADAARRAQPGASGLAAR